MRSTNGFSRRFVVVLVPFLMGLNGELLAQVQDTTASILPTDAVTNSSYVRLFPKTFTARIYLGEKVSIFTLRNGSEGGQRLPYRPNAILGLGVGVTIRGIGLNFSTRLPLHDQKEDLYGITRRRDLQVHRYRRRLAVDAYLQQYRGFHLSDSSQVSRVQSEAVYPYFPDLQQLRFGATVLRIPGGDKYSMRAAVNQQEWQRRSAGSLLYGVSLFSQFIHNGGADILPPFYRFPQMFYEQRSGDKLMEIQNYSLCINAGGGYNYVFPGQDHWFVGGSGDVGVGPAYSRLKLGHADGRETIIDGVRHNISANLRLQAGYNSEDWFAGVYTIFHGDRYGMPGTKTDLTTAQGLVRAVVARRFHSEKLGRKEPKPVM
jgi:hypothetical protein